MTLACYIRDDLRARIAGGRMAGPVTLREIAGIYGVSLTPVQEAVDALVAEKVLRRSGSGRLSVPDALPRRPEPVPAPAPPDWHQVIARDVMRRSLRGEADFLREEVTAEAYGVGRTVLRQVFARLAGAGVLEHVPRRGWQVRPFREEDVRAYLEVRELLEVKALELAGPRLDRGTLARLLERNRPSQVDDELHPLLIEGSGNRFIQDFFRRHGAYYMTLFYFAARGAAVTREMARQHREILARLLARRWDQARDALSRHIRDQGPVLRKMMARLADLPPEEWPDVGPRSAPL